MHFVTRRFVKLTFFFFKYVARVGMKKVFFFFFKLFDEQTDTDRKLVIVDVQLAISAAVLVSWTRLKSALSLGAGRPSLTRFPQPSFCNINIIKTHIGIAKSYESIHMLISLVLRRFFCLFLGLAKGPF